MGEIRVWITGRDNPDMSRTDLETFQLELNKINSFKTSTPDFMPIDKNGIEAPGDDGMQPWQWGE